MTTIYSGALHPKKKHELQALAADLGLDNTGTKDDVQERIKTHLASHQELSQDERFAGLYSRKKVSRAIKLVFHYYSSLNSYLTKAWPPFQRIVRSTSRRFRR